jgi:chromosome segregation ATPase
MIGAISEHTIDRILSIAALILSPFASISLARWLNRREQVRGEERAETGTAVDIFEAHLSAFRLRVEQLEAREKELSQECEDLRTGEAQAHARADEVNEQNGRLLRENYQLRHDLDQCRRKATERRPR